VIGCSPSKARIATERFTAAKAIFVVPVTTYVVLDCDHERNALQRAQIKDFRWHDL
jgi:hypothetical protein